ncbi:MAG: calcium-translocating P-type ATPase, PMCA-type [Oscillospiraceae bacterium]|jgi:calcium-translocating P-type ATPase|nr:calcium-translocating P-type ATPase, PMCA-type [Oscillospiraceae bacterium]
MYWRTTSAKAQARQTGVTEASLPLGLDATQVAQARALHGGNALSTRKRRPFLSQYLENFADPIIRILLIALGVNLVFLLNASFSWYEPVAIGAAILIATLVSTLSEYGNQSAFEKLQQDAARVFCRVRRGGALRQVPIDDLVVGDVVLLGGGERVPADGRLLAGALDVDQSALNGETKEAHKAPPPPASAPTRPDDLLATDRLFRGGVVTGGEGTMVVQAVGDGSFYGRLAQGLQEDTRDSPMRVRLGQLAGSIANFGYIGAGAVTLSYLFYNLVIETGFQPARMLLIAGDPARLVDLLLHCAMLAMSVIIMAVPEGLPMMITVVLSANMRRMLRDKVLVRKLVGIETAGSLNLLFTDKTGTLTEGSLRLRAFVDGAGRRYAALADVARSPGLWSLVYACMAVGNAAAIINEANGPKAIGGNATDRALLEALAGLRADLGEVRVTHRVPFDPVHKFSAARVQGAMRRTLVKGAPERVLAACTHYVAASGGVLPLGPVHRAALQAAQSELGGQAARLLALAVSESPAAPGALPQGMTLVGLVALGDALRPEAAAGVAQARRAGVQVVMITGDSRDTAMAVARQAGLMHGAECLALVSDDLAAMTDDQLLAALPNLRVVARALPEDKSRLVRVAQGAGLVVGMTGDGINDAPALKLADVGFAMGEGTEVAKEAGDVVILDNNFASIGKAIRYGRTIFKSIRKFIIFQLTVNLCAVSLAALGPVFGIETPITVLQMLWINMVMDTLAALAFSGEPPLEAYMDEPPKSRAAPILNGYMVGQILTTGLYAIALCLYFLLAAPGLSLPDPGQGYPLSAFFGLFMFIAVCNAVNARTHRLNLLHHLRQNALFMGVMGAVAALQVIILQVGGPLFHTTPLSTRDLLWVLALAATVVPVDMTRKWLLRRRPGAQQSV